MCLCFAFVNRLFPAIIVPVVLSCFAGAAVAQHVSDTDDLQLWNDIALTVPISRKVEFNAVGTLWLGGDISRSEHYRFTAGITYKPFKLISIAPYTAFISARNSTGRLRYEYRTGLKLGYRFPFTAVALSHKSNFEIRSRPGRNSWRYRPSITIKKKLPEAFVKGTSVYATEELFYDSIPSRFSRNRISFGFEKVVNKKFAIDLYYLYQGDNFSRPASIHVIGANWKISL